MGTKIEWLQSADGSWNPETWNPVVGCEPAGVGCLHCYAKGIAHRGMSPQHRGMTRKTKGGVQWTGEVRLVSGQLEKPLRWRKSRMVMVPSMGDLFHGGVPDKYVGAVFGVMAACPQHFFVVPTKRTKRAREWLGWAKGAHAMFPAIAERAAKLSLRRAAELHARRFSGWPLPNVCLLASISTQADADRLIPDLLACPAAVHGVSYEPAIGEVDFSRWLPATKVTGFGACSRCGYRGPGPRHDCAASYIGWLIAGSESTHARRPASLDWFRSARDQCVAAGVPFFLKAAEIGGRLVKMPELDGRVWNRMPAMPGERNDR
jgi:protein gp37